MAEIVRYVNTDSTAGGNGTTNATTGDNRAYASMDEWEEAERTDLVSAGDWHHVYCSAPSGVADTIGVFLMSWTTDATHYVLIESADDHGGKWDTSIYRLVDASGGALYVYSPNVWLKGLQIQAEDGSAVKNGAAGAGFFNVENCLLRGCGVASANKHTLMVQGPGGTGSTVNIWNNVIFDNLDRYYGGIYIDEANADFYIENNTFVDISTAMRHASSNSCRVRNNQIDPTDDSFYGTFTDDDAYNDYNVTTGAAHVALGSHGSSGATFGYTNAAGLDFSPTETSDSVDAGEDESSGNIGFSTDILGNTRSGTWDVGAFEYAAEATGYTIEADTGGFSAAGQDADLSVQSGITMDADAGAFSLAGSDVDLLLSRTISADSGALSITGADANLSTGAPLIIDHTAIAKFDIIPAEYIAEVKKLLLVFPGASHACAVGYGLENLAAADSTYALNQNWTGAPAAYEETALRWSRTYRYDGAWEDAAGEENIYTNAAARGHLLTGLQYLDSNYSGDIYFGWGWCWDMTWINGPTATADPTLGVHWYGTSVDGPEGNAAWGLDAADQSVSGNSVCMDTYLGAMQNYIDNSNVKTFLSTGPVDSYTNSEAGYQRYLKHEYIRDYVDNHGATLFDWADILSWNYITEEAPEESYGAWTWPGIGDYAGSYDGADTNGGVGRINCHLTKDACTILGKAMWVLLAMEAGWDGTSGMDAESGTFSLAGSDAALRISHALQSDPGAFALTGFDAHLGGEIIIDAEGGAYIATGEDAALLRSIVTQAESGAYLLTGTDADLHPGTSGITGGLIIKVTASSGYAQVSAKSGEIKVSAI